jgi:asparagine synthase (glutamine-hydrolysing)
MCGILAVLGVVENTQLKRARIIELSRRLRHRGPDWSGLHSHQDCYLAHQRLAIVDPTSGDQPLYNEDKTVIVTVCIVNFHFHYKMHACMHFCRFTVELVMIVID